MILRELILFSDSNFLQGHIIPQGRKAIVRECFGRMDLCFPPFWGSYLNPSGPTFLQAQSLLGKLLVGWGCWRGRYEGPPCLAGPMHMLIFSFNLLKILYILFCIGAQPINNVVIVSGGQQRRLSHMYTCIYPPYSNSFPIQAAT